ncbi:DUF4815 domain-containing protein [Bosea sp. (in: a-proteobacteria)]|uniref:DUF4815 domain-containing protein n=1 Tax=Bosea sp. (in: a-proteobacteria) TaxID=1871050 RepID=UPI001AC223CC|nr:DUF4815 domain-containing protein [Bosea sp. (in: a-proteobacteria)]MBN9444385.1 DUF4815 domain-containing protein [Bosea sp. (in: a-proteobacteria)]
MAFEHPSGVPAAYDRAASNESWSDVVFREDRLAQAAEVNDAQTIASRKISRVGNMVAKSGDRIGGGEINVIFDTTGDPPVPVDPVTMTVSLSAGRIYVAGDVLPVPAASFSGILADGEVTFGVRLLKTVVDESVDPSLLGLHPGTEAEGEPGAVRLVSSLSWAMPDDGEPGDFFSVYLVKNGAPIDQAPPPALSGVLQTIAVYDYDALGNYVVDGCEVSALGKVGSQQIFSIAAGTANIKGYKRIRESALRHAQTEEPELEAIAAEPHTFTGPTDGSTVITVSRPPIASISAAVVVKEVTQSIVRGASPNGSDALSFSSVVAIVSVTQGATEFVAGTDFTLSGDAVSWAPGGDEPAASSTYTVTYRYNSAVVPTAVTDTTVTLAGGVNGTTALVSYSSKLPRKDILCLDITGRPVYVNGISARVGRLPPLPPENLLKLAEIDNDWLGAPTVDNNGTRNFTADDQRRLFRRLIDVLDQFGRAQLEQKMTAFEPVSKRGIFTDLFVDDFYRDQGEPQTAAVNKGVLQLAIDDVLIERTTRGVDVLPWVEEIVVRQDQATSSIKINPYMNFVRMPAGMLIAPAVDFWTTEVTEWTSPITREFSAAPNEPPGQDTINEVTEIRRVNAQTLRQIEVTVSLSGFGVGENLATLTFAGVDVKPPGTQTADANGEIMVSFTIPAGIPVGRSAVRATGAVDSFAEAIFVGEGTVDITTMRRVTLIARAAPVPVVVNVVNETIINQITVQQVSQPVTSADALGTGAAGGGQDPLAQTFTLPEPRHVVGVNFKFTAIGDRSQGVRVQLARVSNGTPTGEVMAEAFINMQPVVVGELVEARFAYPVYLPADREFCFIILTSDSDHAVAMAKLGDVDVPTQTRVSSQPYTVGVLLTSANRLTWTAMQDADLFFHIVCAKFTAETLTVDVLTADFDTVSDVIVRGAVELPSDATRFRYELVRATGQVIPMAPAQTREFTEFISEEVTLRAVLDGTENLSPVLYPGTMLIGGRIRTSGNYVSRAFPMGAGVDVRAIFASLLPAGATVAVHVDAADDDWNALSLDSSGVLGDGWSEPVYEETGFSASEGRVRVTLTGGPGARPSIAQLRAYSK